MPGLLRGVARTAVIAGTATAVSNNVSRRQAGRWADQEQQQQQAAYAQQQAQQQAQYQQQPPAAAPSGSDARIEKLKELAALRDQGILSEAEFEAEKQRVLAG